MGCSSGKVKWIDPGVPDMHYGYAEEPIASRIMYGTGLKNPTWFALRPPGTIQPIPPWLGHLNETHRVRPPGGLRGALAASGSSTTSARRTSRCKLGRTEETWK